MFQKFESTISEHMKKVFTEGELEEKVVVRKFRTTTLLCRLSIKPKSIDTEYNPAAVLISLAHQESSYGSALS